MTSDNSIKSPIIWKQIITILYKFFCDINETCIILWCPDNSGNFSYDNWKEVVNIIN